MRDTDRDSYLGEFVEEAEDAEIAAQFLRLTRIMRALRAPDGCPWDRKQTHQTLKRFAIEEVYELVDAIDREADGEIRDELGDVLLQVVFHAQLAAEDDRFTVSDVAAAIADKLERRHPHVFSDMQAESAEDVEEIWNRAKAEERSGAAAHFRIKEGQPPLQRALKMTKEAAKLGFDWDSAEEVVPVLKAEIEELQDEIDGGNAAMAAEELGDVMFSAVNLARKLNRDPDELLRAANRKFERRFGSVLRFAEERGLDLRSMSLAEMDELWNEAKLGESENSHSSG
jgi:MazG family protein